MVFIYMFSRGNDLCEIVLVGTQKQGVRRIIKTFETKITIIRKYQFTKNSISKISWIKGRFEGLKNSSKTTDS